MEMSEASKRRSQEEGERQGFEHDLWIFMSGYQSGMQDPNAGKHECDDICLQDMNLECPISYPKELVSKELLDECEKILLIAWGELEAGCKEAEQVEQMIEKIREARK